jgi:hypothetical protein
MGAIQAQDFAMAKWAIGLRLPSSTEEVVETALDKGDILRTHLMRPTWHIISANDICWILALTAPAIKALIRSRLQGLELTHNVLSRCRSIFEKALAGGNHLTREELMAELWKAKIETDGNRSSHILMNAELDGIICSGASKSGKPTYALLDERVPVKIQLSKEEALAMLAGKYFRSHGPATLKDFAWWSGMTMKAAAHGLETVKPDLISETIDSETYWMSTDLVPGNTGQPSVFFLPAYDEYIISYKNRDAILPPNVQKRAISENGLFRPVIIADGKVIGLWKRTIKKDSVVIEPEHFTSVSKKTKELLRRKAEEYSFFLGKKLEIVR